MENELNEELARLEELASLLEAADTVEAKSDDDAEVKSEEADAEVEEAATEEEAADEVPAEETADEASDEAVEEKSEEKAMNGGKPMAEAEADDEEEDEEDEEEDEEVMKKADAIFKMMRDAAKRTAPSVFLSDIRFKEGEDSGELITEEQFDGLDSEEQKRYMPVNVLNADEKGGMAFRYRLRDMMDAEEKGANGSKNPSVFLTATRFKEEMDAGDMMDDEAYQELEDDQKKGYQMVDVYDEKTKKGYGMHWRRATPLERDQEVKKKSEDEFLCGFQRKSVAQPCAFCRGGCAPEGDLPGLSDVEAQVKSAYSAKSILGSGYSSADEMFVVDLVREDGAAIEVFLSSEGKELGWLRLNDDEVSEAQPIDIVSQKDAEVAALEVIPGKVASVMVDVFEGKDAYSVEIDGDDNHSYDVYVGIDGKVYGYDQYDLETDDEMSEEDEIKALEAELEMKRMYSREQREDMAESGEALPDGSYPIADKNDLQNAIQAFGRAKDKEKAKAHIMKRAKELGMEDMIPENWMSDNAEEKPAETDEDMETEKSASSDSDKATDDLDFSAAMDELKQIAEEEGLL